MTFTASNIEAILFDMNGTLRRRLPDEPTRQAAIGRFAKIIGAENISEDLWNELALRRKKYDRWNKENELQISEEELWSQWLLPEYHAETIKQAAAELTLAWSERKGRTFPLPGADNVLRELHRRGYRLGLISNSISSLDIPHCLEEFHWKELFEVVILSGMLKIKKPAPGPFLEAAGKMGVLPGACAYVGNHFSKDMPGCRRAGFGAGILFQPPDRPRSEINGNYEAPDAVIESLYELLLIFEGCEKRGAEKQ